MFCCSVGPLEGVNIALGRPATQSSTYLQYTIICNASLAVDGSNASSVSNGDCADTYWSTQPWWAVDLGEPTKVRVMTITNRGDCCRKFIYHKFTNFLLSGNQLI